MGSTTKTRESFEAFVHMHESRLHRAFVASLGPERGSEALGEALTYGWEHWDRLAEMDNPVGYLFRVGQSKSRSRRQPIIFPEPPVHPDRWFEPGLGRALSQLSEQQRLAVLLVEGQQWTISEVADLSGVTRSTVQTHLERGLKKLREELGVEE